MGVKFDDTQVNTHDLPQTVEASFRVYGGYANVHDYKFESAIDIPTLTLNRTNTSTWTNEYLITGNLGSEVEMSFDVPDTGSLQGGFLACLGYNAATTDSYVIGITNANEFFVGTYNWANNNLATLIKSPVTRFTPTWGNVKAIMRQQVYSSLENDTWLTFALWVNDCHIGTFSRFIGNPIDYPTQCGFLWYGSTATFVVNNIRVPQLSQFVDWCSVDPGETPIGGLERTIEGRYVKYMMRHNGQLKAWRSKPVASSRTFTANELYVLQTQYDKRELYSHLRILGAYVQSEYASATLVNKVGHRFKEVNNPYLMSKTECYEEARNELRRMYEACYSERISSVYTPALETEDRIVTPTEDRIISTRTWRFRPTVIEQDLDCRYYGYST